jgi:hypothetical protein
VVAGHLVGVLAGYFALFVTAAWSSPMLNAGWIGWKRVGAVVLAAAATVFVTLLINAAQPAAIATTLIISLGPFQKWQDGIVIMCGAADARMRRTDTRLAAAE